MEVIGYLRVSTEEQASSGLRLEAQRARIVSEAAHKGWNVRWLVDEGYSAKNLVRPAMTEALQRLASHEAEALVVAKLDRLSRSVVDFSNTLTTAKKQGWAVVLLDLGVDTTTPNGKLVAGLMASSRSGNETSSRSARRTPSRLPRLAVSALDGHELRPMRSWPRWSTCTPLA